MVRLRSSCSTNLRCHHVLESAKRDTLVPPPPWRLFREAVYGDTRVSFLSFEPS
jgi:hypothetical protein